MRPDVVVGGVVAGEPALEVLVGVLALARVDAVHLRMVDGELEPQVVGSIGRIKAMLTQGPLSEAGPSPRDSHPPQRQLLGCTMRYMATTADRLLKEALKLAPDERARLVAELLATLEPDLPSQRRNDQEWIREIERRAREAASGSPGVAWPDARDQIRSRLSTR
jgi:Putative addiction module component